MLKKAARTDIEFKRFDTTPGRVVSACGKERKIMRANLESSKGVTELLLNWQNGDDEAAAARLMPLVYEELRRVARGYLQRERSDHTLQATALVHEAYLQLVDDKKVT